MLLKAVCEAPLIEPAGQQTRRACTQQPDFQEALHTRSGCVS